MSGGEREEHAALLAQAEALRARLGAPLHDQLANAYHARASAVTRALDAGLPSDAALRRRYRIDRVLTSRLFGYPIMLALLALVFYLTVGG
jgi:ferrous iron transport protein B